jgi:membrane protein DedA with SNARE-associated domain
MDGFFLSYGYPIIFLVLVLTGSGLPLPEEVPIIAAGVLSAHGQLNPWVAFVICWLGAVLGDCIMYYLGYHFGRGVFQKHPWWVRFVTPEREAQIEQKFRQHGLKVFFIARFLVFFRSPLFLTAGILRVSFRRFVAFDAACATAVVGVFFGLSYWFGRELAEWLRQAEFWLTIGVAVSLIGLGILWWRRRQSKKNQDSPE